MVAQAPVGLSSPRRDSLQLPAKEARCLIRVLPVIVADRGGHAVVGSLLQARAEVTRKYAGAYAKASRGVPRCGSSSGGG